MSVWYEQASKKLEDESKAVTGAKALAMRNAVKSALLDFCKQDDEFAKAVVQGKPFKACMEAVERAVNGNCISDLDAYRQAVSFYFPGAGIKMQMKIDLCDSVKDAPHPDGPAIVLDLRDFL